MAKYAVTIFNLLLSAIVFIGFISGQYQDFRGLKSELSQKQTELQNQEDYFKSVIEVDNQLKERQLELEKIKTSLPPDVFFPAELDYFQKLSSSTGLILKRVELGERKIPVGSSAVKKSVLNLGLSGNYPSLRSFLSSLEKNARIFEVESLSFSSSEEGGEIFPFNLTISFYYLPWP